MSQVAYVHLGYGFGAAGYREKFARGLVPDPVPYGFHHAEAMGWQVLYSVDHPEGAAMRLVRRALNRVLGFDLVHAWRNRRLLRQADVVWTMEERQGLALLFLGMLPGARRPAAPVVLQIIWLFDQWPALPAWKRGLFRRLLRRATAITVHSREYLKLGTLGGNLPLRLLPFGISADSFAGNTAVRPVHAPLRVLAMGSDPTRDWPTFLTAFGADDRFEVVAISPRLSPEDAKGMTNVTLPKNPTMQQFNDFYAWADFVVVPMVDNLYSGITVALEAARQGVPVVCSRTGGVPTYFAEDEVIYVDPEQPVALRETLLAVTPGQRDATAHRAQARFAREDYTTRGMAARYVTLSEQILHNQGAAARPEVPQWTGARSGAE